MVRRLAVGALWFVVIWFVARLVLVYGVIHMTGQDLPPGPRRVMVQEQAVLRFFAQYGLWIALGAAAVAVWGTWAGRLPGTGPRRSSDLTAGATPWEPWETATPVWGDDAPAAPAPVWGNSGSEAPAPVWGDAAPPPRPPIPTDLVPPRRPCHCGGANKICPQCRGTRGEWRLPTGEQGSSVWVPCPYCLGSGQVECTACDD